MVWTDGVVKRNAVTRPILLWFWLFVMGATAGAQERPRVVQTFPENGATAVDPATNELRVVFDQPMGRRVSFVGGGPTFPELVGRLYWTSTTTVVLPVINPALKRRGFKPRRSAQVVRSTENAGYTSPV